MKGRSTQDINAMEAFTKVNPRKFTILNYYQVNSFMLEVCLPYEIVTIYYTILSATWKFQTLRGRGKSLRVKAYCSELLKILWWNFGNMLSLVYILCDSIYKDIGQFKSGLPISPFDFYCSFNQLYILFRSKVGRNLKNSSKGASGWFILFWGSIIFLFPDARQLDEENNKKIEKLSISWVVAEKLPNHIEIAKLLYIFFH